MYTSSAEYFHAESGEKYVRYEVFLHVDSNVNHLVGFELTKEAYDEFNNYETEHDLLIAYFSALCIKYGSLKQFSL